MVHVWMTTEQLKFWCPISPSLPSILFPPFSALDTACSLCTASTPEHPDEKSLLQTV